MTVLKYLLILLTAILGIFAVIKDYKKKSGAPNKIGVVLIVLILVSMVLSFWLDNLTELDSKHKEDELKVNIITLKQKNDSLSNNLNETRDTLKYKISQLEKDNFDLSRELTKNSIELNKNILGEGYAIFQIFEYSKKGTYYAGIKSNSKYPLYDITLLITDFDKAIKCNTFKIGNTFMFDQDCYFENSSNVKSNNLAPTLVNFVDYNFQSTSDFKHLEIIFTT